jgi:ethanolamine utilization protein EutA (predicted chaperonin)
MPFALLWSPLRAVRQKKQAALLLLAISDVTHSYSAFTQGRITPSACIVAAPRFCVASSKRTLNYVASSKRTLNYLECSALLVSYLLTPE